MLKAIIRGYHFIQLTSCCPEQYSIQRNGVEVAYARLRYGQLSVSTLGVRRVVHTFEDEMKGSFSDSADRCHWLARIAESLN